ncbi:WhiB family transcriptional regulator [Nocardia brasiliensis]|uniref:WhiB family transcriptional regulator n=1 Tax=Nocardia brasiliensis TaxID=37326 RepID=UPI00138E10B5
MEQNTLSKRLCQSVDPEVFFPEGNDRPAHVLLAQVICTSCPALRSCAHDALRIGITHGIVASVDLSDPSDRRQSEAKQLLRAIADGSAQGPLPRGDIAGHPYTMRY